MFDLLRFHALLAFSFLSLCLLSLGEDKIIDGQWNNKPWPQKKLMDGVAANEPEALAEWAYCSYYGENGAQYDQQLIFQRSQMAAEKGSIMGKCMLARCYMARTGTDSNLTKCHEWVVDALPSGHPFAMWSMGRLYLHQKSPVYDQTWEKAYDMFQKSADKGNIMSLYTLSRITESTDSPYFNSRKSHEYLIESIRNYRMVEAAITLKSNLHRSKYKVSDENLALIEELVDSAVKLEHHRALYAKAVGFYEAGYVDKSIQYYIRAVNQGSGEASASFSKIVQNTERGYNTVFGASASTLEHLSFRAYSSGDRSFTVQYNYVRFLMNQRENHKGPFDKKREEIIEVSRQLIAQGDCNAHDLLGKFFLSEAIDFKGPKKSLERSAYHYTYHSNHDIEHAYSVGICFLQLNSPDYVDLVRGYAALKTGSEKIKGSYKQACINHMAKAKKRMTPEQLKEAEALYAEGYPLSEKFRKAAFEALKECGDIPKDAEFDEEDDH